MFKFFAKIKYYLRFGKAELKVTILDLRLNY